MTTRSFIPVRAHRRLAREEGGSGREQRSASVARFAAPPEHVSVMTREVVQYLAPQDGQLLLDATAGAGGHSETLLEAARIRLVAFDADPSAVERVRERLSRFGKRATVVEANFRHASDTLLGLDIKRINGAVFDLGWNRAQLASGRGFSFQGNEPLSMSYGRTPASGFTARDIVNTWSETAIADALFGYGEERYARRIAREIVRSREGRPIETTGELVEIIARAVPAIYRRGKLHFATRSFQALRIAVNDELRALEEGIRGAWNMLARGGRIAVISFHSIEDRAVKRLFAELARSGEGKLAFKKPLTPSLSERHANPSARSAKLRVIERVA